MVMASLKLRSINDPQVRATISQATQAPQAYHSSPLAWEDQLLYFLLPDRFATGCENTTIALFSPADQDDAVSSPDFASEWRDSGIKWQGGTLHGIKSKLGYLKRIGVTAVWIGPIFKQVPHEEHSYHGYAVQNFLDVDPHFGTREDLRDLVTAAHEQEMYVILDIILNHSGDVFEYKGGLKNYTGLQYEAEGFRDTRGKATVPFGPINDETGLNDMDEPKTFTREGKIMDWDAYPEFLRGDFETLKDINLGDDRNPGDPDGSIDDFVPSPALETLCEVYKYWIAYADLDGYRVDTVKHMGDGPTRHLCTTLHEYASTLEKNNFFIVGEVTGSRAYDVVQVTGLDAALGIGNVQESIWQMCKGFTNPEAYFNLFRNAAFLRKGSDAWMRNKLVTMIDDHDQVWRSPKARFCSDELGRNLILAAVGLNLTTLGIPCIYYGTEQLFDGSGGNDRYIREAMFGGTFGAFRSEGRHFFDEDTRLFQAVGKMSELRKKHRALRRGRQYLREISANGKDFGFPRVLSGRMKSIVAWSRILAEQELLCAINTDTENSTTAYVTIDANLHRKGEALRVVYDSSGGKAQGEVQVLELHGKAVLLAMPPSAFLILGQLSS
jgi:glycosidase